MIEALAIRKMRAQGIEPAPEVSEDAAEKMERILARKLKEGFGTKKPKGEVNV